MDSNQKALDLGYDYAKAHFACPLPIRLAADGRDEGRDPHRRQHRGGARLPLRRRDRRRVVSDHAVDVADGSLQGLLPEVPPRARTTNQNRFAILQAEDELAAIGMVIGASWAGARAFTPTSGPGISLMNEFIGLAYYAEVPAVIFDVQRTGPSTGMPTRTQQGDLMMCAYASHGDTRHICLYPVRSARGLRVRGQVVRPRRALPDAGVRAERSRHRHERLDGPEADVGRQLPSRPRQGAVRRRSSTRSRRSIATSTRTATASRTARCRACTRRARTSRAARATTGSAPTPRTPTSTPRSSTASIARFSAPREPCRRRSSAPAPGAQLGLRHRRRLPRGLRRGARPAGAGGHRGRLHARARLPVRRRGRRVPRGARDQLRRRAEPRRAAAQPADARDRRAGREAASRCATTADSR